MHRRRFPQHDILLVGAPGSEAEAFTMVKHMKIFHGDDTREEQLAEFRSVIWKILVENSRSIVQAIRNLGLEYLKCSTKAKCEYIMNHRNDTNDPDFFFLPRFAQIVQDLWLEEIIPLLLDRPWSLSLADNAEYFFAEAHRIATEDYVPSIEDIGHASEREGVVETNFDSNHYSIRISQVYGQVGCFRKWIPVFDGITSVMFCASLADYDERGVSGCGGQTRLAESLTHFGKVVNSPWFTGKRTSVILFLTGMDEFKAKLHEVPLNQYFPEYTGGTDADKGAEFILSRFAALNNLGLSIFVSMTEVSSVASIRFLMNAVSDTAFENMLRDAGFL